MKKLLTITLALWAAAANLTAQYTNRTDLPAIYIETFDGGGIYSKETYKYCRLHYVDEAGAVTSYDSVSIRGRGNSTWGLSKKPYRIKFHDKEKFLGKGYAKCKSWTLMANAGDKTMMRNAITSAMGEFCAALHTEDGKKSLPFNPAAKFTDLVLNGTYLGTYQISDHVDVRPHRVNITEQDIPSVATSDITGGYLLEVDGFRDGNSFTTSTYNVPVRIHYPDEDDIAARQTTYIKGHVSRFENALSSADFTDPETGYRAYVDSASLIDWYICTEVSANIDGFFSTYFYKEQGDDHLYWGPLWDYDIAYNNDYRVKEEQGLSTTENSMMADIAYNGSKVWVNRMWQDPWFQRCVYARYKKLLEAGLVAYIHHKADSLQQLLRLSQQKNYEKWGISTRVYHEMVLYSSYDRYVSDLKTFVSNHCAYLEQEFAARKPFDPTPPFVPQRYYYHIVNSGTLKAVDVSGGNAVQYTDDSSRESEDWEMRSLGDGLFLIVNRSSMMALNDPTQGDVGPTVNVGTPLNTALPDEEDPRQQWQLIPQGTDGYYNLLNTYTQHIANLRGGSADDYTDILSYTNDSRNSESKNRMWLLMPNGQLPDDTGVDRVEPEEYALAYNPVTKTLHFGSESPEKLSFKVNVIALNGIRVGTFTAGEEFPMSGRPAGIYIVNWAVDGRIRSVKFNYIP